MTRALIASDTALRNIKPGDPRKRLNDGEGLYLLLFVKGGAHGWRFDYSIHGRRKTLSLGTYPDTGLKLARIKANAAREQVAAGNDPSDHRKAAKADYVQAREIDQRVAGVCPRLAVSRKSPASGSTSDTPNGPRVTATRSSGGLRLTFSLG